MPLLNKSAATLHDIILYSNSSTNSSMWNPKRPLNNCDNLVLLCFSQACSIFKYLHPSTHVAIMDRTETEPEGPLLKNIKNL